MRVEMCLTETLRCAIGAGGLGAGRTSDEVAGNGGGDVDEELDEPRHDDHGERRGMRGESAASEESLLCNLIGPAGRPFS